MIERLAGRLRYRFDTFMGRGGASVFVTLTLSFLVIFGILSALRLLVYWVDPGGELQNHDRGAWGQVYTAFLEMTDPGSMSEDIQSSVAYKAVAILSGLAGIIMLSSLIGFITTGLDQKISSLRRGHSKVIEKGHTLILGWDPQRVVEIVRELITANESKSNACIVILSQTSKEEMDDHLRLQVRQLKSTRLVTRCGDSAASVNLDVVSVETCRSVIVLADCNDSAPEEKKSASDAKVIQTLLALTNMEYADHPPTVVAEVFNPEHRRILLSSFPDNVITIDSSGILAKMLVQTSRSIGLSVVYNEILSFSGSEMYFFKKDWGEKTFAELAFHLPDGIPIGLRGADGKLELNPDPSHRISSEDSLLVLAHDDSTIKLSSEPVVSPPALEATGRRQEKVIERELVLGWTGKTPTILQEFAGYVIDGSSVDIMVKSPSPETTREIEAAKESLSGLEINHVNKNCLRTDDLMSMNPFDYDNIIILGQTDPGVSEQQVDSENIVTLLLLREIFREHPEKSATTKLITEVLDSQNQTLVAGAGVKDVIISNRLVGMMLAQISEEADMQRVYDYLFEDRGSEIYIKPAGLYFETLPGEVTFAEAMSAAQSRNEVCLGVKTQAHEDDATQNFGIELIPAKSKTLQLEPSDSLIILASDEF